MKAPRDRNELQTVLGMITYLSRFAPSLSEITTPIRSLTRENTEFVWDSAQEQAFDKVKQTITQAPVLAYYDPHKPLTLQEDASKHGLGATLLQEGKPITFASKFLPTLRSITHKSRRRHMLFYSVAKGTINTSMVAL